ncbi:MsnO8 family LLM class oxidoreductase [Aerococcus sanguinicola]|uniref:MsnO8 family LLM class oxidoreductase n=1 Tax=Aerococcus sanguinicola TaxID=119206 RepID=A0A0X8FAG2_9LACT|nr:MULTISPECIES: MsnO8 family LLM class oxidoreductase [Aerococcus]AMB93570.1 hypothetical protein AWM72_01795 [Aerococcus sanguinicola]MDK7050788.1 MsnO8 family LLM class oxidoreductase [Aerococcus sanguinicola]OFT97413.1 hypothetical protein HMPREF3090_00930 [Aerococcus sp. HMSC23C02]PKZ21701.1 MsnO8 family LLM class oxidoreductase [Aerococcus sanguinicola]
MNGKQTNIGILDFIPRDKDTTATDAFDSSAQLIQYADQLQLKRYWFAEHHSTPSIFSSSPFLLTAHFASKTEQIRVGVGGAMVNNQSTYQMAEKIRTLQAMYLNRVDAGLGKSRSGDAMNDILDREFFQSDLTYEEKLQSTAAFLANSFPPGHPYANRLLIPHRVGDQPELFILAGSANNVQAAARMGFGLNYGLFINSDLKEAERAIADYRANFEPSAFFSQPRVIVSLYVVAAYDEKLLPALETAVDYWSLAFKFDKRSVYQLLSVDDAADFPFDQREKALLRANKNQKVVGTPKQVASQLQSLKKRLDCDEFMVLNQLPAHIYRKQLLEILSEIVI